MFQAKHGRNGAKPTSKSAAGTAPSAVGGFAGTFGGVGVGNLRISPRSLYSLYRSHPDLKACVFQRARNVGRAGVEFVNADGSVPEEGEQKRLRGMLDLGGTFGAWKNRLMRDVTVTGNFYGFITMSQAGTPMRLTWLDPKSVSVVTDQYGKVIKWVYQSGLQEFGPDQVLHFFIEDDPDSSVFGLSPVEPLFWELKTDLAAVTSNHAFFENDAAPSVQYIMDDDITEDGMRKFRETLDAVHRGAENRHKSAVLAGVKEIKTISVTPKDMEFSALRRLTTEKVCAAMGVPKTILNYTDGVNYSNGREQFRVFRELTVDPDERLLEQWLTANLLPKIGLGGYSLRFRSPKDDDREWDEASTRADQQQGILTINEVRQRRGLKLFTPDEAGEWADKPVILAGASAKPLEDIGIDPTDMGGLAADPTGDGIDPSAKGLMRSRRAMA